MNFSLEKFLFSCNCRSVVIFGSQSLGERLIKQTPHGDVASVKPETLEKCAKFWIKPPKISHAEKLVAPSDRF